jgi:peroxiredoxin
MTHIYYCILWGICLILAGCIRDDAAYGEAGIVAGDTLPEFQVELDNGSMLATSDLQGKVSVLVFFHTGCPDCQQELPVIQQLYDLYRANDSVAIYCISREEAAEEIEAYWQAHGLTLPYSAQESRSVYNLFSGQGIPRVYVSDKSLQVYSTYSDNPIAGLDELTEDVEALRMKNKE